MVWARMLAYITGTVDQELLLRNEYLAAENRILKVQIKGRLLLSDGEKATLSEIAYRLGRKALREVAMVARPETILAWYRRLIAHKFDGPKSRRRPGRPRVRADIESLVVRMAKENPSWGYDRIVGAWRIWATKCQTKPWATFCGAMELLPHPCGRTASVGKISFAPTWMLWRRRTSSPPKS